MSTDKKSAIDNAAKSLDFDKLSENEEGQLTGGFSDASDDPDDGGDAGFPEINISKCHCTSTTA